MEIKNLNGSMIKAYKAVAGTKNVKENAAKNEKIGGENVDKLDFDISASLTAAKANIASGLDAETNTAKIETLSAEYAGDNCPVNAEQIASSMFFA